MKKITFIGLLLLATVLIIAGCGNLTSSWQDSSDEQDTAKPQKGEKMGFRILGQGSAPKNQGDMNIRLEGLFMEVQDKLMFKGSTNLLAGSRVEVRLMKDKREYASKSVEVENDGTYELELKKPNSEMDLELRFTPEKQNDNIKEHYGAKGEKITGSYVRIYEKYGDEIAYLAVASATYSPEEGKTVSGSFEKPKWKKPADYGQPNIWINPELTKDENYLYVYGTSNLIEGARILGEMKHDDFIFVGYSDSDYVKPDGSFYLKIKNPQKKNLFLLLNFEPSKYQWQNVKDAYGEKGEKLEGNLVKKSTNIDKEEINMLQMRIKLED